jgi:two-component system chemotaxis response regulator CheB
MPQAAINESRPHEVCLVADMGARLGEWLDQLAEDSVEQAMGTEDPRDELTPFTCPECGGTLWGHDDYGVQRFRCRVGHSFSADGLLVGKRASLESALWAAIVALEEKADLTRRVVRRLEQSGRSTQLKRYRHEIALAEERTTFLRGVIGELVQSGLDSYDERRSIAGTAQ